jgi:hypothetical protein
MAGLSSAHARGRLGGRPKGISKSFEATACAAETLYKEGKLFVYQIKLAVFYKGILRITKKLK